MTGCDENKMEGDLAFGTGQVMSLAKLTRTQISHWCKTCLISPEIQDAQGGKSHRRWSFRDVVGLRVIRQLLSDGLSVQRVRRIVDKVREWTGEQRNLAALASARVVVRGGGKFVDIVTTEGQWMNLWPLTGCGQMYLFDLREAVEDVQRAMKEAGMDSQISVLRATGAWILEEDVA